LINSAKSEDAPSYLSVVAVSRNDDHGGDPLRRTQLFIDSLAWQAGRYSLSVELLLVDWNPPRDKPGLAEVLAFPVNEYFTARVVVVPPKLHIRYRHGDRLPLFQMIGKNVGIRRARGEFVLAANIDILLADALFARLAQRDLEPGRMYRADRYDIANNIAASDNHADQQAFCRETQNQVRRNHRQRPAVFARLQERDPLKSGQIPDFIKKISGFEAAPPDAVGLAADAPLEYLHTMACGDFTLLHRDAWAALRGYAEFETYSMHIDSIGCIQAHLAGYREVCFLPPLVCCHIEHAPGSGYTPEGEQIVYDRLRKAAIPSLPWSMLEYLLPQSRQNNILPQFNDDRWGLRDCGLAETVFAVQGGESVAAAPIDAGLWHPAALKPEFGLDNLLTSRVDIGECFALIKKLESSSWRRLGLFLGLTWKMPDEVAARMNIKGRKGVPMKLCRNIFLVVTAILLLLLVAGRWFHAS
jgi:hypothetical protein